MRITNNAEIWEQAYEVFQQVNFAAWDYNTIKQSLIDYLKIYRPEDFNDYIESSEFVTILETFAYLGELLAYRVDMNSQENFISTAQRKESVLRLAKLLSYNASRNIPARGLVKITSISTTERLFDSRGNDLTNRLIYWNDQNNVNWKEQFLLVINSVIDQNFGSVLPSDRVQVNDILFELYTLKNTPFPTGVVKFAVGLTDTSYPMEIVPTLLNEETGPYEKRPEINQNITMMYLSDGLGDASPNTGFFYFVKQGILAKTSTYFDGITPNQFFNVNVADCNQTDIWVNNVDPSTGDIIVGDSATGSRDGEWVEVDIANAQNVIFNTSSNTNKYEIETLNDDAFRLIFGDGNFAKIPSGKFDVWYRVSANESLIIPTTAIQNISVPITYVDESGKEQIFISTISLTSPIQNSAPSEDIEHIRRIAPAVYYTQDRMVNGQDYNEFMLQDNSILKLRAVNRTFAGDSKYIAWHDPSGYYENVKIFGDDLVLYYNTYQEVITVSGASLPAYDGAANVGVIDAVINNYIQPILQGESYFMKAVLLGIPPLNVRKTFNATEILQLQSALLNIINSAPGTFYMVFNTPGNYWSVLSSAPAKWDVSISIAVDGSFTILVNAYRLTAHSDTTKFWMSNNGAPVVTYDTLNSNFDNIVILKANISSTDTLLSQNYKFRVLRQDVITQGAQTGMSSTTDLIIYLTIPITTDYQMTLH